LVPVIAAVINQRELFASMLRREVRARYKGSALGVAWSLVTPLVMMGAYTLVFSLIFTAAPFAHYPAFLLTGLTVWVFFGGALQTGTASLVANANLVKKVAFERAIVPLSTALSNLVTFAAMFVVLVPVNLVVQPETRRTMILLPALVICLVVMTAGLTLALAALNVYFRDVEHILGALLLPWFFLTPIFYSLDQLPGSVGQRGWAVDVLRWGNPITPLVESIHDVAFFGVWPSAAGLAYVGIATLVCAVLGVTIFARLEPEMAVEL
jgi:ABC-type polysaccharide/polyol phosphate export permease